MENQKMGVIGASEEGALYNEAPVLLVYFFARANLTQAYHEKTKTVGISKHLSWIAEGFACLQKSSFLRRLVQTARDGFGTVICATFTFDRVLG